MSPKPHHPHRWQVGRGETRATGAWLPGAVAPVGTVFAGSCQVLALRAGRVSTVSIVHDAAAGQLSAWKTLRDDDRDPCAQFRRSAERWSATEPIEGMPEPRELRVWGGRTFLAQELIAAPSLAEILYTPGGTLWDATLGAIALCRTVQDAVACGYTAPGLVHAHNVHAESLSCLWLTDPTAITIAAPRWGPDLVNACGRLLIRLFGITAAEGTVPRARWEDAPATLRRALRSALQRCVPNASLRFRDVGAIADYLDTVLDGADDDLGATVQTFPVHTPRSAPDYQAAVHQGYHLLHFGCFELAEGAFRRALALAPWSLDARLGLAETLLQTDNPEEGVELATAALGESADDPRTWQTYARALLATAEDPAMAQGPAERAIHLAPHDAGAILTLAQVVEITGDTNQAETLRREAAALAPLWAEPALAAGFLALDRGDHAAAVHTFTCALRANPLDAEAWQGRALALEHQGEYGRAARSVDRLVALLPQSEEFRAWGGRLRMFGERPDAAAARSAKVAQQVLDLVPPVTAGVPAETRQDLETALGALDHTLQLRPDAVALWCLKGELQAALGDAAESATCFTQAIELDGESGAAWLGLARARLAQGDEAAGMEAIMQALSVRRPMAAAGLLGAELHWRQGRRGAALRLLEFTVAMAPAWAPAWYRFAAWAERLGDPRLALRAGRALRDLPAERAGGLRIMARQLVRLGAPEEASALCREALETDDGAETWAMLAEVQRACGDRKAGRRSLEHALDRAPDRADLWCVYAEALLADGDARSAAAVAQRATRLAPDSNAAWRVAGQVHLRGGHSYLARRAFGRALKQDQSDAESWCGLAEALLNDGRARPAMVAADRATSHDPERAEHWCVLGRTQLGRGAAHDAAQSFDRAISLAPDFVPAWHLLAVTEVMLGRYNAARRNWQRVLALAPDHRAAQEGLQRLLGLRHRGARGPTASKSVLAGLPGTPLVPDVDAAQRTVPPHLPGPPRSAS